jgi:nucleotide-binding universal stress UspA family protein
MYSHILVAVSFDGDRDVDQTFHIAERLLAKAGKITLLHVMEEVPGYALSYMPEGFRKQTKEAIASEMDTLAAKLKGAQGVVVQGHSGRTILDWASKNEVDCIVVASHRPGMQDYVLGSTAAQVVRHAQCSVHVVR